MLAVNYRGSSGRGQAWKKAIYADWGNKEVQDLLAGVDHVIASGIADPNRLGLGGWSYGGILTDYTIATTTRFRAATSGAGSALQSTMYGSDQYIYQYERNWVRRGRTPRRGRRSRIRSGMPTGSRPPRSFSAARRTSTSPSPAASRCTRRSSRRASTRS